MTADLREEVVADVLRRDGWTCEYHEPVNERGACSSCDNAHDETAGNVLAALDAYETDMARVAVDALGLLLTPAENLALTVAVAQVRRGDPVTDNVAATCVLALARIARGES